VAATAAAAKTKRFIRLLLEPMALMTLKGCMLTHNVRGRLEGSAWGNMRLVGPKRRRGRSSRVSTTRLG